MLVGSSFSAKSKCIKTLAEALTLLEGTPIGNYKCEKTKPIYINPKSVKST
jgi:hypothetical protein